MEYKVGDKVRIKSLDWYNANKDEYGNIDISYDFTFYADRSKYCGKVFTIDVVFDNCYTVKEDNHEYYWADEMFECLVEEEVSYDIESEWLKHEISLPDGYIFKDENGNEILTSKIILEKKKKEYPKTYCECKDKLGLWDIDDTERGYYKTDLIDKLQMLLICRDAYWKIAGEEMGLGKPWENSRCEVVYGICRDEGNIVKRDDYWGDTHIFEFPIREMRDAFYENFKSEIEICKELL